MSTAATSRAIDAIWRIESPRLIAALTRLVRDVGLAEDLAQDALVAALERWPEAGVPDNPGAWLMATAKNRAIDLARRGKRFEDKQAQMAHEVGLQMAVAGADVEARLDGEIEDDLLGLVFVCCHPVLSPQARIALTLKLVGGLSTPEIARAFLVSEATLAQRIGRAKKALSDAGVPFELSSGEELAERLPAVLEVIYLIFNEGYAATTGDDWVRPELCEDALRLGRILAELMREEPEVHGLVALMEIQASRTRARIGRDGEPVLLEDQDRSRWDWLLVTRGIAALDRAMKLDAPLGPYGLQAAIAACHARARRAEDTDWVKIAALYETLARVTPSPIVELNRAVAVSRAFGPEPALALVDQLAEDPAMRTYHLVPSVRADLLSRLGRHDEARSELERAASLAQNARERAMLLARAGSIRR